MGCLEPPRKSGLWPLAWELLWEMPKKQLHQEKANIDESNGYRYWTVLDRSFGGDPSLMYKIIVFIYTYRVLNFWFAHKCLYISDIHLSGESTPMWYCHLFMVGIFSHWASPQPHVEVHLSSLSDAVGLDRTLSVLTPSCPSYVPGTCPCRYWMSWNECRCGTESLTEGRRKVWPRGGYVQSSKLHWKFSVFFPGEHDIFCWFIPQSFFRDPMWLIKFVDPQFFDPGFFWEQLVTLQMI